MGWPTVNQKDPLWKISDFFEEEKANVSQGIVEVDHAIMHQQISQNHDNPTNNI